MADQLAQGHYWGATIRRWQLPGIILTETVYPPRAHVPRHSHSSPYLCYIRRGGYLETYGSRTRECGPRMLAFHPGGEEHAERFGSREVSSFNVELCPEYVARNRDVLPILERQADFRGEPLAGMARRLYEELRGQDAASPLVVESMVTDLIAQGVRQMEGRSPAGIPRWLERTRELLHDRFLDRLALEDLAREAGVHPVYLASAFRRHYSTSIGEYLRRLRVEHAARELQRPDAALADIAIRAGFADQAHFTRVFKDLIGLTPGQYRAQRMA